LLGDEGSGWSMGKEGVKSLLTFAANDRPLLPFHHEIMERLGIDDPHNLYPALALSMADDVDATQAEAERKKKIAGCTKHIVVAALGGDGEARRILKKVASEVVELLRPLVEDPVWGGQGEEGTLLVLGGGLSSVDEFRQLVVQGMEKEGWNWGDIEVVSDPAVDGVKALATL
jgi:N-acetylglucosamine kinase-like BadF-type ATPase